MNAKRKTSAWAPRLAALAALTLTASLAAGDPPATAPAKPATAPAAPDTGPAKLEPSGKTLPTEGIDWHARAEKWFDSPEPEARKKQMRTITRALRRPCKYCHTPDFDGYTDKKLISQQMMALSKEHGVTCDECHAGRDGFTQLGRVAHRMWSLSVEKGVTCDHCHVTGARFERLTEAGREQKTAWEAAAQKK